STGPEAADVPDVTDMPREDAEAALEDAGFEPEYVDSEDEEKTERGIVTRTKPAAGTTAQRGDTVQIWDATGSFTVPDVRGTDVDSATSTLKDIGFEVDVTERPDGENEPGTVLEQTPPGDSSQTIGSTIKLIVATPEGPVSVPNVTGHPLADARDTLAEARCGHTTTEEHYDRGEEGCVIRAEPGATEEVGGGAMLPLVVAAGVEAAPPEEPSDPATPTPAEPESEAPPPTETEQPPEGPRSDEPGNGQDVEGEGG